jgi:hypothetical protein
MNHYKSSALLVLDEMTNIRAQLLGAQLLRAQLLRAQLLRAQLFSSGAMSAQGKTQLTVIFCMNA